MRGWVSRPLYCLESTYKELKPHQALGYRDMAMCLESTYKELKLFQIDVRDR